MWRVARSGTGRLGQGMYSGRQVTPALRARVHPMTGSRREFLAGLVASAFAPPATTWSPSAMARFREGPTRSYRVGSLLLGEQWHILTTRDLKHAELVVSQAIADRLDVHGGDLAIEGANNILKLGLNMNIMKVAE